jgi:hypothetical protein
MVAFFDSPNFKTSNGPDVHVYLVAADDANDNASVERASFIDLGEGLAEVGEIRFETWLNQSAAKAAAVTH